MNEFQSARVMQGNLAEQATTPKQATLYQLYVTSPAEQALQLWCNEFPRVKCLSDYSTHPRLTWKHALLYVLELAPRAELTRSWPPELLGLTPVCWILFVHAAVILLG